MSKQTDVPPVLILGAGINGCAVARELVLNGVPVTMVDTADIATGATAKSSRLIHGGLRYLEYADMGLVSESLAERELQLEIAPQFVRPLRLHIPVRRRLGGLVQSAFRFFRLTRFPLGRMLASRLSPWSERGLICVRMGLWMYDWIARSSRLPGHTVHRLSESPISNVNPTTHRWVCSYSDAQMLYPERFVIALLKDAELYAANHGIEFRIFPYHHAQLNGRRTSIFRLEEYGPSSARPVVEFEPSVIINATGAWGDSTLKQLGIEDGRLFGGTKGSHILTRHKALRQAIGDDGIYAETADGRLVFVLPFRESTLIGTTDLRFDRPPDEAVATSEEVSYLVDLVNAVFSGLRLSVEDVDAHYSGVRPLPYVASGKTGSISRGHFIHTTHREGIPLHTLIGGKLTTWRPFAVEVADRVLAQLGRDRHVSSMSRAIPGAEEFPRDVEDWCQRVSKTTGHSPESVHFLFPLMGTRAEQLLAKCATNDQPRLPGLPIPPSVVSTIIAEEWVTHLQDLVERRLALVFGGGLNQSLLVAMSECFARSKRLSPEQQEIEFLQAISVLKEKYGIRLGDKERAMSDEPHSPKENI